MGMDEIADRARQAYKKITGCEGMILWRKIGRHSHAETFCLQDKNTDGRKLVIQIFIEPSDKLILNARYEVLPQVAQVHEQNDFCRFVKPIACLPEYDAIITDYIAGEEFWPMMRRRCRRFSWTGMDDLLRQIQALAVWTVRLDRQTRSDINCDEIMHSSLGITIDKVNAIRAADIFSKEQTEACIKILQDRAKELLRQRLYSIMCHGDLCPANVLISSPFVYVVDIHRIHRGLPFEDVAYFLSTIDILLMESYQYNPGKVERMKTVFLNTFRSYMEPFESLLNFQYLTAQIQVLNYYTSTVRHFSGARRLVNRFRMKNLHRRLLGLISGTEKTGVRNYVPGWD